MSKKKKKKKLRKVSKFQGKRSDQSWPFKNFFFFNDLEILKHNSDKEVGLVHTSMDLLHGGR